MMKIYSTILRSLRKYLFAGLGMLLPLFISLYIIYLLFSFSEQFVGKFINTYLKDTYGFIIPGLGFLIILAVLIVTGFIATHLMGRKLFSVFEMIITKIPIISNLYPSARQLSDFLFKSQKQKEFRKVVLVEFPYQGAYSIGFVTNEDLSSLDTVAGEKLISVFIALAPAPFSGFLLLVTRDKIKPLDIPFETAIKYIVSGGIVFEPRREDKEKKK